MSRKKTGHRVVHILQSKIYMYIGSFLKVNNYTRMLQMAGPE